MLAYCLTVQNKVKAHMETASSLFRRNAPANNAVKLIVRERGSEQSSVLNAAVLKHD